MPFRLPRMPEGENAGEGCTAAISVIVPAFNAADFLAEALESIVSQTCRPHEILVVDDGSTDRTVAIARATPGVRCLSQPNLGLASARNAGIAATDGELIAHLDADDIWLPNALEILSRALAGDRDAGLATAFHVPFLDDPAGPIPAWMRPEAVDAVNTYPLPSSWLVRRSSFELTGGFDESYRHGEDLAWLARSRALGIRAVVVEEAVFMRRLHGSNLTGSMQQIEASRFRTLREHLHSRSVAPRPGT